MQNSTRKKFVINSIKTSEIIWGNISKALEVKFIDSTCGKIEDKKTLIAYASKYGSTNEVATYIGNILCQTGNKVDIRWVKNIKHLNEYDNVIIGSPIQYDTWMSDAIDFITIHQDTLSKLNVSYFFTCLTLSKKTKKAELQANKYANNLYELVPKIKPKSIGRFAGVLDFSKMPFFYKIIFKGGSFILGVKERDYRNWDDIKSWAEKYG